MRLIWIPSVYLQELLWESEIKLAPLLIVVIPALPKDAAVELHVTAVNDDPSRRTTQHVTTKMVCGSIRCHTMLSADRRSASLSLSMIACGSDLGIADVKSITEELGTAFMKATKAIEAKLVPQCARVFYKCSPSPIQQIVQGMLLMTLPPRCHNKKGAVMVGIRQGHHPSMFPKLGLVQYGIKLKSQILIYLFFRHFFPLKKTETENSLKFTWNYRNLRTALVKEIRLINKINLLPDKFLTILC